jgi:hypothetical protein
MNTGGWPYSTQYPEPLFDERGNPLRWSLVDGKAIEDKPNEDILSCFLGKVFRPAEGRYAPDESWPGKDDFPFYPTLDSALYNRHWSLGKQGLSRYVIEFPVIVLATNYAASPYRTGNALLLIGKRPFGDKPFEGCAEMVFGEPKISPFLSAPRLAPQNLVLARGGDPSRVAVLLLAPCPRWRDEQNHERRFG